MINLSNTDLLSKGRNELLEMTKQELEFYKIERQRGQVSNNIPRIKNLEKYNKRLGAFAIGDLEVSTLRGEINTLLNEDVYKSQAPKEPIQPFSSAESYINARLRSK